MRGRIDGVFDGMLRGWAWDPARPGLRLTLRLLVDGEPTGPFAADLPRADLEQAGMGDGRHGLEVALPLRVQDGATHEIVLEAWWYDDLVQLDTATPRIALRRHMLRGRVEGIRQGRLRGWAWDQARPDVPVALELWHEGAAVARLLADRHRIELAHGGIGGGAHGFELDLAGLAAQGIAPPGAELELRCAPDFGDWSLGRVVLPLGGAETPMEALPVRHFLDEARQAEARQDHTGAARIVEHGLRLHPDDFNLLVIRARALLTLQQWEAAEEAARQAQALNPDHPSPIVLLARLAGLLDRHAEAAGHWSRITPQDSAWRERMTRRPQHLAALGRTAEVLAELTLAARHRPEDPELARRLADAAEALGAPGAARIHLRRLAELAPGDRAAAERLAALDQPRAGEGPGPLASPLQNPELRNWLGPVSGVVEGEAQVAPGLALRGTALRFAAACPYERRPGELPSYGLRLEPGEGGAEAEFALEPLPARPGLRMGIELRGTAGLAASLLLRCPGQPDRTLLETEVEPRLRLLRFDLPPAPTGTLLLRLDGPGALLVHPPRPLARLALGRTATQGFEAPGLAGRLPLPARRAAPVERLAEPALPFTTIEIAAPPATMAETLRAVLDATSPFECILAEGPAALDDPRIRILPPDAAPAEGWVARVEAPPRGGPGWLAALHRAASGSRHASAPGVRLEWRAAGSSRR